MLDPTMAAMTATGQLLGSPAHMAPEQVESGDAWQCLQDTRADVRRELGFDEDQIVVGCVAVESPPVLLENTTTEMATTMTRTSAPTPIARNRLRR